MFKSPPWDGCHFRQTVWSYEFCFQLIIWLDYHIHVKGEVSSLVVNKMAYSVMTAPPGKSVIRLKREIWTWACIRTRIAQVVERRARNPEVRVSNPGCGSNFSLADFLGQNYRCKSVSTQFFPELTLTQPMAYGNRKFNVALTRILQ